MKQVTEIQKLTIFDAVKIAKMVRDILKNAEFVDFQIVLSGSIVVAACGWPLEREPQDIDLRVRITNGKSKSKAMSILKEWNRRHSLGKRLNTSENVPNLIQLNVSGIGVDLFFTEDEIPIVPTMQFAGFSMMPPIEIYRAKMGVESFHVGLKSAQDLNRMIMALSEITVKACDNAKNDDYSPF